MNAFIAARYGQKCAVIAYIAPLELEVILGHNILGTAHVEVLLVGLA